MLDCLLLFMVSSALSAAPLEMRVGEKIVLLLDPDEEVSFEPSSIGVLHDLGEGYLAAHARTPGTGWLVRRSGEKVTRRALEIRDVLRDPTRTEAPVSPVSGTPPIAAPEAASPGTAPDVKEPAKSPPTLQGTFSRGQRRFAILDGESVEEGTTHGEYKVDEVLDDRVRLSSRDRQIFVNMPRDLEGGARP